MQIQKHLYRIAERALKNRKAYNYWGIIFGFSFMISVVFTILFLLGNFYILPTNNHLSLCFQKSISQPLKMPSKEGQQSKQAVNQAQTQIPTFQLQKDAIYIMYTKQFSSKRLEQYAKSNKIIIQNEQCTIIKDVDSTLIAQKPLQFTWTPNILYLDSTNRHDFKFQNYTIVLKNVPSLRYYIYSINTLIANQLISNPLGVFPANPCIKSTTVNINSPEPQQLQFSGKLFVILKAIFYYLVISVVTSLYIYGTIVAAPAVIIMFLRCSNFARNGNMADVYKVFPWIGMHALIRQTSENPMIKNSSNDIFKGIVLYFFFLYFVYYSIVISISTDIFYQKTESGLQEMLFGFIALVEFCSIVFMRTRPFLRYFPVTHTLLITLFLIYAQFCPFGLKKLLCTVVSTLSASLFAYMVLKLQIPAQTTWDRTKKYTPSVDRPRIGLMPLFNMSWINNLPDQWTLMFPLFGRENFTNRELSFVDRNFEELDQVFNVNAVPPPAQPVL